MVKVFLHGKLGEDIGNEWELDVTSVSEGLRAIEANTKKLKKWIIDNHQEYVYVALINNQPVRFNKQEKFYGVKSDLCVDFKNALERIDIVPVIQGAFGEISKPIGGSGFGGGWSTGKGSSNYGGGGGGGNFNFVGGSGGGAKNSYMFDQSKIKNKGGGGGGGGGSVITPEDEEESFFDFFIDAGNFIMSFFGPLLPNLLLAGLSLLASGITALLAKPPPSIPYTAQQFTPSKQGEITEAGGPTSYLFNGPVNTLGEGGPVPVGYGRLIVGGHVALVSYDILYKANIRPRKDAASLQDNYVGGVQFLFNEDCMLTAQEPTSAGL
jgi:predicted phage tail protein